MASVESTLAASHVEKILQVAVAVDATVRSPPVDPHRQSVDLLDLGMTHLARHVFVGSVQIENRVLIVVKLSRLPVVVGMARRATIGARALIELSVVNVFVTAGAFLRRR